MPAELRDFLLRCSVLPELTAERCAAVSGDAQRRRAGSRRSSGAACSSPRSTRDELTLRLHDLFRDFLEDRLRRELPHELPSLLRRAADNEPDPCAASAS